MKRMVLILLAAAPLMLCGCVGTFKEVTPVAIGPAPAQRPTMLVLGETKVSDGRLSAAEQRLISQSFQMGVEKWCAENKSFAISIGSSNVPPEAIVLTGDITEVEKGSASERFWVGMGAGQAKVAGQFTLTKPDGKPLGSFNARKSYLGGQGIGGWDMMDMNDLAGRLGQLVAEMTDKWVHGEKME